MSGFGLPRNVSEHGGAIDALLHAAHLENAALILGFTAFIVFAALRFNRRHPAAYMTGTSRRASLGVLGVALGVFLIVDGTFFVASFRILEERVWNFAIPESNPRTTRIEITARQWAWDVRYPGPDHTFNSRDDIVLWNELRVPLDAPVHLQLGAADVVHSLFLPNFRQKMDAVPGQINRLWFQPTEPGTFELACAQHCGANHYRMRAVLHVMPRDEFDVWAKEASLTAERAFDPADTAAHWGWPWK